MQYLTFKQFFFFSFFYFNSCHFAPSIFDEPVVRETGKFTGMVLGASSALFAAGIGLQHFFSHIFRFRGIGPANGQDSIVNMYCNGHSLQTYKSALQYGAVASGVGGLYLTSCHRFGPRRTFLGAVVVMASILIASGQTYVPTIKYVRELYN